MALPPGDRHVLVGTVTGRLQLYELNTGSLLEDVQAHGEENEEDEEKGGCSVSSICLTADSVMRCSNFVKSFVYI